METNNWVEDYYRFRRTWTFCGKNWWAVHCPHDGIQNPCPSCEKRPITVPSNIESCDCEFMIPVSVVEAHLAKEKREAILEELETLKQNTWSTDQCWNELNDRIDKLRKG